MCIFCYFFFTDTATTEIYTLSLHDALPIWQERQARQGHREEAGEPGLRRLGARTRGVGDRDRRHRDRKSTRLNSSHSQISYAVFCLKKKKKKRNQNRSN